LTYSNPLGALDHIANTSLFIILASCAFSRSGILSPEIVRIWCRSNPVECKPMLDDVHSEVVPNEEPEDENSSGTDMVKFELMKLSLGPSMENKDPPAVLFVE
jgi:hypothetical protein